MAHPTIILRDRKIILLSGYSKPVRVKDKAAAKSSDPVTVYAEEQLRQAARRDPDAVAFGFVQGTWVASA